MKKNKIFVLLPDGVGLRNFAFSDFYSIGKQLAMEVVFWNITPFCIENLGYNEIKITNSKTHFLTDIFKNALKHCELTSFIKKTNDEVYNSYRFPFNNKGFKNALKTYATKLLIFFFSSVFGVKILKKAIDFLEQNTAYYKQSLQTLQTLQPALVFCTSQRSTQAIAPILAAKKLKIPTACFIFSWDNIPKATLLVTADYYMVWSEHMKKQLLFYYPTILEKQVFVTGTSQFESHFIATKIQSKVEFYTAHQLSLEKTYIGYSGDDVTTCPDDPQYLEDVAIAVQELNRKGSSLGIIFRRCPVDFSGRFDKVLKDYKDVITPIEPLWKKNGDSWNTILPTPADIDLQSNTIAHSEFVINLGSSMVFDYATHNKACAYINYDVDNKIDKNWSVKNIYNYVHFRSMPSKKCVVWFDSKMTIADNILQLLHQPEPTIWAAKQWFEIINQQPANKASERLWTAIVAVLNKK